MENKIYIGIHFKPKTGGLICIYDINTSPRFWYFKSGANVGFIAKNLMKLIDNRHCGISIHMNDVLPKDIKQTNTYNQIIGMISGIGACRSSVATRIVTEKRIQSRVMQLLDIKRRRDFKSKLISKKMHGNKYNIVYDITSMKSRQSINIHRSAYLLAYYGYLKDKIRSYNKQQELIHVSKENQTESAEVRSSQDDGPSPENNG